jgi:hypothetical protein
MGDGRRYEMPIVDAVRDQNANPSINSGHINAYTTLETFQWLGETKAYNQLLCIAAENKTDPDLYQGANRQGQRQERTQSQVCYEKIQA